MLSFHDIVAWDKVYFKDAFDPVYETFDELPKIHQMMADDSALIQLLVNTTKYTILEKPLVYNSFFHDLAKKNVYERLRQAWYYFSNSLVCYYTAFEIEKFDQHFFRYNLNHLFDITSNDVAKKLAKRETYKMWDFCEYFQKEDEDSMPGPVKQKYDEFCEKIYKYKPRPKPKEKKDYCKAYIELRERYPFLKY